MDWGKLQQVSKRDRSTPFAAQFDSMCERCASSITEGDMIVIDEGSVYHIDCVVIS